MVRAALVVFALLAVGPVAAQAAERASDEGGAPGAGDPLDRGSPRETVAGFLDATDRADDRRARDYLDLSGLPAARRDEAARELRTVLDRQVWIDLDALSAESAGDRQDGLAADRESLGWLDTPDGPRQVLLTRVERDGGERWLFAGETVVAATRAYDGLGYGRLAALLPAPLIDYQLFRVQLWQWIALLLLVVAAYVVAWLATRAAAWMLAPLARRTRTTLDDGMLALALGPARLLVAVAVFSAGRRPLQLTAAAATVLSGAEYLLALIAVIWICLRLIDVAGEVLRERLRHRGQNEVVQLVPPGRRTAKVCVVGVGLIAMLDGLGFDVTALVAGLGIGGLAVALAAQKSIENLLGGITLYADRPVQVGDFCRFGETVGTVEDIGLRSTRVRTLERCLVTVPNAEFSNMQLENFSARDKFWYHPTIGLRYETSPDQLRYVLVEVRRMLYAHPRVDPEPARIRFVGFGASSLDLEVFAYVRASDFDDFLEVAEDLHLRIMDIVSAAGSSIAFPSRTLYVEASDGLDRRRGADAERQVEEWREHEALYLPRFPTEKIAELRGTAQYPPPGTPGAERRRHAPDGADGRRA